MSTTTTRPERTDADRAHDLLDLVAPADLDQSGIVALANVYATLAYVETAQQAHRLAEDAAGATIDNAAAVDRLSDAVDRTMSAIDSLTATLAGAPRPRPFPLLAVLCSIVFAAGLAGLVVSYAAFVL